MKHNEYYRNQDNNLHSTMKKRLSWETKNITNTNAIKPNFKNFSFFNLIKADMVQRMAEN